MFLNTFIFCHILPVSNRTHSWFLSSMNSGTGLPSHEFYLLLRDSLLYFLQEFAQLLNLLAIALFRSARLAENLCYGQPFSFLSARFLSCLYFLPIRICSASTGALCFWYKFIFFRFQFCRWFKLCERSRPSYYTVVSFNSAWTTVKKFFMLNLHC